MIFWLNLWLLGLSAALLTYATQRQLHGVFSAESYIPIAFNFFATICSYAVMRSRLLYLHPGEQAIVKSRTALLLLIFTAGFGASYFLVQLSYIQILKVIPVILISAAYFLPVLKTAEGAKRLRDFYFIKHVIVGFMWAGATVLIVADSIMNYATIILFIERTLFIASLSLLFDHRDFDLDTQEHHKTILKVKGWKTSQQISLLKMILAGVAALLFPVYGMATIAKVTVIFFTIILIRNTSPNSAEWWYNIVLECTIIFYAAASCLAK